MNNFKLRATLSAVLLFIMPFAGFAQKLPNMQKVSVRAPVNIKIDGKATEWNNQFKAYNHAIDAYYTLSNDDVMLYLTLMVKDQEVTDKIIRGGISLTVNHSLKKHDATAVVLTYPVLRDNDMSKVSNMLARKIYRQQNENGKIVAPDTLLKDLNKILENNSKLINLQGIKEIDDESISIYNENHIKTVGKFGSRAVYVYELAIPLKYLNLPASAFSYNIKVNEPAEMKPIQAGSNQQYPPPMVDSQLGATDCWGEYTLAKKQ